MSQARRDRRRAAKSRRLGLRSLEARCLLTISGWDPFVGDPYVWMGPSDNVAWDQPRVAIELFEDAAGTQSLGPTIFNYPFVLDTGANSVIVLKSAVEDMASLGYQTEPGVRFIELGVAGEDEFDISLPYRFDFSGTSGQRMTLTDTRVLSSTEYEFPLGPLGIVGMPAMAERVTTLDMTVWTDLTDYFMHVDFAAAVPPAEDTRLTVPATKPLTFDPNEQVDPPGSDPPVWSDVPFVAATAVHGGLAESGNFLYDTGAQMSVLSTRVAKAVGLDSNGDDVLDERDANFVGYQTVGGVGGTVSAPMFAFDAIRVPTTQGFDLIWTDLQWLVLDVSDGIDGVLGSDLITSGWIEGFAVPGRSGYAKYVHFDFRGWDTADTGQLHFDLNPEVDAQVNPAGPGARIIESGGQTTVSEMRSGGDFLLEDTYQVVLTERPDADVTIALVHNEGQLVAFDDANPGNAFLTFTPDNWDQPQTVRVQAVDDAAQDAAIRYAILHDATSADPDYDGVGIRRVVVNVIDDEAAGVLVIPSDGSTDVVEGTVSDTYQVVLTQRPSGTVRVVLENRDGQLNVYDDQNHANGFLEFDSTNWNVPQTVRVEGVADGQTEGPHFGVINHVLDTSDPNYEYAVAVSEIVNVNDAAAETTVVDRHVFYNNSTWDASPGNPDGDPAANQYDDNAVAPHTSIIDPEEPDKELGKDALLPGQTASFVNYTSYSKGLNGIMVDISSPSVVPTLSDFIFKVGNSSDPSTWDAAPVPQSLTVVAGAGTGGSDRVTIIWADDDPYTPETEPGAISNEWLQVTVLGANLGLPGDDVFYFGNAIGECGNSTTETNINQADQMGTRNHPHTAFNPAPVYDAYDYNRDGRVNQADEILARNNPATVFDRLQLITAPASGGTGRAEEAQEVAAVPQETPFSARGASAVGAETLAEKGNQASPQGPGLIWDGYTWWEALRMSGTLRTPWETPGFGGPSLLDRAAGDIVDRAAAEDFTLQAKQARASERARGADPLAGWEAEILTDRTERPARSDQPGPFDATARRSEATGVLERLADEFFREYRPHRELGEFFI